MSKTAQPFIRVLQRFEAEDVIDAVFRGMSLESRRLRFHVPMPRLPAAALVHLADVDKTSRVALGAWVGDHVVGIARMADIGDGGAEMAIAVVDDWHGLGIGSALLRRLVEVADELGYRRLVAEVLVENTAMLRLLDAVFPTAVRTQAGHVAHITLSPAEVAREAVPPTACRARNATSVLAPRRARTVGARRYGVRTTTTHGGGARDGLRRAAG